MRRRLALIAALALGLAAPSFAQTEPAVLQPETAVVSPGGVDMNTGQYRDEGVDLSMGSDANGGITFKRVEAGGNKSFTSNWHIFLNKDCENPPKGIGQPPCVNDWKLESMAVTKTWLSYDDITLFEQGIPSPGYTKLQYTSPAYRFTMADGTIIQFESASQGTGDVWASTMTRKDGVVYSFTYDTGGTAIDGNHRLVRVKSNTGYELILEYVGTGNDNITKACVFNTSVVTPPVGNICPTGTGVQTASYVHVTSGNPLTSITDAVGKTWTIDRQATVRYFKPVNSTTPWLVNTLIQPPDGGFSQPFLVVSNQQLADGRSIDYSYANLLIYESDLPQRGLTTGRGMGWTVNGSQTTQVGWAVIQQNMGGQPGPLHISPAPNLVIDPLGRSSGATYEGGISPYGNALSKTVIGGRQETYTYSGTPSGGSNLASRTWHPRFGTGDIHHLHV